MLAKEQMIIGDIILHMEEFIKHKWGNRGLESYKEQGNFSFEKITKDRLYPLKDYIDLLKNVQQIFNDDTIAFEIGRHRARHLLLTKGIRTQGFEVLDKVASSWYRFNSFGEISINKHDMRKVSVFISNYESDPLYCERTRGFFTGLICGVKETPCTVKEVKCVCDGQKACEFIIEVDK